MWRCVRALPERGKIGIFNRSYYEEVLVVRVHPELLEKERIPAAKKHDKLWASRFREINQFEHYLVENGIEVLKFFLHLSKDEQKRRFLARLESRDKNWKFSEADVKEREFWDDYQAAFEEMLSHTSTVARALARHSGRSQVVYARGRGRHHHSQVGVARSSLPGDGQCATKSSRPSEEDFGKRKMSFPLGGSFEIRLRGGDRSCRS